MTKLNTADAVCLGSHQADKVYLGANQVWATPFPKSPILDTFNRANGALGANWTGPFDGCSANLVIASNALVSTGNYNARTWHQSVTGNSEAYLTNLVNVAALSLYLWLGLPSGQVADNAYMVKVLPDSMTLCQAWDEIGPEVPIAWAEGDSVGIAWVAGLLQAWHKAANSGWRKVSQVAPGTPDYLNVSPNGLLGIEIWTPGTSFDNFGGGAI